MMGKWKITGPTFRFKIFSLEIMHAHEIMTVLIQKGIMVVSRVFAV